MKRKFLPLLFSITLLSLPVLSLAQNSNSLRWIFGNTTRTIQFNRFDSTANIVNVAGRPALGIGGSAVATHPVTGNLLFYTNGQTIYDQSNRAMPNGSGLTGNSAANQPVVVAQVPGQPNQYYVITNSANFSTGGDIQLAIVDMSLTGNTSSTNTNLGDVISKNIAVPGLTNQSEGMIVIPHANGTDFWLITHTQGTTIYNVTQFTSAGPAASQTFDLGLILRAGNFSFNPTNNQIAVSPQEANRNVEILEFDNASGSLILQSTLANSSVPAITTNGIYDVEWSPSGDFLYISKSGDGSTADLLQFDVSGNNPGASPISVLPAPVERSYGLILGLDSAIYHLYQFGGQLFMGKITEPDEVASLVNYDPTAIDNAPFGGRQFPSFLPPTNLNLTADFTFQGTCLNQPTKLFPTVTPGADSVVWSLDGSPFSRAWSPVHTFEASPANVTLTAFLNGQSVNVTKPITLTDFDIQITLPTDTTACAFELPEPNNPAGPKCTDPAQCFKVTAEVQGGTGSETYTWYGPDGKLATTGLELSPNKAGYYYLVVSNGTCEAYAGVNIKEYEQPDPRSNMWFFGNNAGVDFNPLFDDPSTPAVGINGAMTAPEGSATISDRNGNVLFYTDGISVWDRNNTQIATDIGGDPNSSQSSIVMPVQGDETLFYIFTTEEIGSGTNQVNYTLFDLKLNDGNGGIVDPDPLTPGVYATLYSPSTERLAGAGNWLITHDYGNNTFRAYEVTPEGIGKPVYSTIGSDHSMTSTGNGESYMVVGSNGMLAVGLTSGGSNLIELFDFDQATGGVTNYRSINLNEPVGEIYGIAFSPGGEKMYVTLNGAPDKIIELAYNAVTDTYTKMAQPITLTGQPGAIQQGPDGNLYVAVVGGTTLSSITVNTDPLINSTFDATGGIPLASGTSLTLGLPNFTQIVANPIQNPGATVSNTCVNSETQFSASGKDSSIDQFTWTFQGAVISTEPEFTRTFTTPGNYQITLVITNKCEQDYFTQTIDFTVFPTPPAPPLLNGANSVICEPGTTLLGAVPTDPDKGNYTYLWSTGATTETITTSTPGLYSVTVTNSVTGCTNNGSVSLFPLFDDLELGPNLDICQNAPHELRVDIVDPNITFQWFRNGALIPNNATEPNLQTINTTVPGIDTYEVVVTNIANSCSQRDNVTLTIRPIPTFTPVGANADCQASNGSINVNNIGGSPGPFTYFATGANPTPAGVSGAAAGSYNITPVPAGVYTVTVVDDLSLCQNAQVATVNNSGITVSLAENGQACHPNIGLVVTVVTTNPSPVFAYEVFNSGGQLVDSGNGIAASPFNTNPLTLDGTYTVRVSDGACESSNSLAVTQNAPHTATISGLNCANNQITATSPSGANTFVWSSNPLGLISSGAIATLPAGTSRIDYVVTLIASGGATACPVTVTRTVTVTPDITADFTQSDACTNPVTLTATPSQPGLSYQWLRNTVPSGIGPTKTVPLGEDRSFYQVVITNNASGCPEASPIKEVRVVGPFNVTMTVPPVLCENTDFILSATPSRPTNVFEWAYNGNIISGQTGSSLTDRRAGVYTVRAFDVCLSTPDDETIVLEPIPSVELGSLRRICPEPGPLATRTTTVIPTVTNTTGPFTLDLFEVVGATENLLETGPQFVIGAGGIFRVRVTSEKGCTATDDIEILVDCDPIIVGPNAFRPGSGIEDNTAFKLITQFITDEDFQVLIFNRWGEMVFESNDRAFRWNGGYKNNASQLLPNGTYAYVVKYRSEYHPDEGVKEKRGGVVLVR